MSDKLSRYTNSDIRDKVAETDPALRVWKGAGGMLWDRLVCSVGKARLQHRLLAESSLTFEKALTLAMAWESAEKNVKDLQSPAGNKTVHALIKNQSSNHHSYSMNKASPAMRVECYHCRGKHSVSTCYFRDAECFVYGEKGRLVHMCASHREGSQANGDTQERWLADHKELEDKLPGEYGMF